MCTRDGSDLGDYNTAVPGPGDLLYDGGKTAWRITAVLELDCSVYDGLWEVEPLGGTTEHRTAAATPGWHR